MAWMDVTSPNWRWTLVERHTVHIGVWVKQFLQTLSVEKIKWQGLSARTLETARPNTLSSRYGLGAFPFHSDFVITEAPPKFILLLSLYPRKTKTLLFDCDELTKKFGLEHLQRALFSQHGNDVKLCRMVSMSNGEPRFRYNAAVMAPYNREAESVAKYLEAKKEGHSVDWNRHGIALVNNWRAFHARGVILDQENTTLHRVAIWGRGNDLEH